MRRSITIPLVLLLAAGLVGTAKGASPGFPEATQLRAILGQPEDQMDLGRVKLTIDRMVDPSTDIEAGLKKLDVLAGGVRALAGSNPSKKALLTALRKYLYEKGPWNGYRPFQYDFEDPLGRNLRNKQLLNYLSNKRGNCVSMPLLFIILGQRLGLDLTAATAPEHILVRYTDPDSGRTFNLEATSGANTSRDEWYRQTMVITDQAIVNGIFLRSLSRRETSALMAEFLGEHLHSLGEHEKVIAVAEVLLEVNPKDVTAMLRKGHACFDLAKELYFEKYPTPDQIPPTERKHYQELSEGNRFWFAQAESLGWREPKPEEEESYLEMVKRNANASMQ